VNHSESYGWCPALVACWAPKTPWETSRWPGIDCGNWLHQKSADCIPDHSHIVNLPNIYDSTLIMYIDWCKSMSEYALFGHASVCKSWNQQRLTEHGTSKRVYTVNHDGDVPKTSYSPVNLRGKDSFWDPSTYLRRHVSLTSSTSNNSARWYVTSLSWTLVSNRFNQSRVAFTNWLVHSLLRALSLPKSANSTCEISIPILQVFMVTCRARLHQPPVPSGQVATNLAAMRLSFGPRYASAWPTCRGPKATRGSLVVWTRLESCC